ncbi:MAG: hemolysin III family protein [Proteobacteria bacterium]|nr:hemolysin III family protein [Pseudomonadota bacterium]
MKFYFREPISGLTHFIGLILAVIGAIFLIITSISPLKIIHVVSFSIFGAGMIMIYLASTLYHWLPLSDKGIAFMRRVDHMMIFFIIAATYTPICLIPLKGAWGTSILCCVWSFALIGLMIKLFWMEAPRWLSTSLYLLMGWICIVAIWPLIVNLQAGALFWLLAGGIFYSVGAVIYGIKKPDPFPEVFGFHELFHVLIMMGTASHFMVMYRYLVLFD